MPNVAIEAVILTPLLAMQIILFPFVASTMSSYWANASRDVALNELASQISSTIQQLYLSVNRDDVATGTTVQASTFPKQIASYSYTAKGSLKSSLELTSARLLILNVTLQGVGNSATAQTSLGPNASWNERSVFNSWSVNASIIVQKFANGSLLFSFV